MATIPFEGPFRFGNWVYFTWEQVNNDDVAQAVAVPQNVGDLFLYYNGNAGGSTLTVAGGIAAGTTLSLTDQLLFDMRGVDISRQDSDSGMVWLAQHPPFIGPVWVGGDGTQDMDAQLWCCIVDRPSSAGI